MMHKRPIIAMLATLAFSAAAHAQDLRVSQAYARATMPHQPSGGAWLTIENSGRNADRLLSASSPAAKSVELHSMRMEGNVMKMREVPAIDLGPAAKLEMKPGDGYHLMLMGLRQPLKAGERFPLTLQFEKAGKLEVEVSVQDNKTGGATHRHGH
jgi:periplasmic copper chaperone A